MRSNHECDYFGNVLEYEYDYFPSYSSTSLCTPLVGDRYILHKHKGNAKVFCTYVALLVVIIITDSSSIAHICFKNYTSVHLHISITEQSTVHNQH